MGIRVDPETWHVLIRNLSGLGFLAILANTFSTLLNGPIVRRSRRSGSIYLLMKSSGRPISAFGQTDLRIEMAVLRHQIAELGGTVQPEANLNRPSKNVDRSTAGILGG